MFLRVEGPCFGNFERWYYDQLTSSCKLFHYGGCNGNTNNFLTEEDCRGTCDTSGHEDMCQMSPDAGPCRGQHQRWYFDPNGICQEFMYGGCGGNGNR